MIEQLEHLLDCKNHLRENLPILIDTFVEFYGEARREEIEEKFSKAIFLAYRKPDDTERIIYSLGELISEELINREISRNNIPFTYKELTNGSQLKYSENTPLGNYSKFYELYNMSPEEREQNYFKKTYEVMSSYLPNMSLEEYQTILKTKTIPEKYNGIRPILLNNFHYYMNIDENIEGEMKRYFKSSGPIIEKIDPNITIDNYSYYLDNPDLIAVNKLAKKYPEIIKKYNERMGKYDKYREEVEFSKDLQIDLKPKYYQLLINENIDLLNEEDKRSLEEYQQDKYKLDIHLSKRIKTIFGYGVNGIHPFDAFTDEMDQELESEKTTSWRKNHIRKKRIEYFRDLGIDVSDDYESLLDNEEVKKEWPTKEQIKKFTESRDRLLNAYNNEYYSSLPAYREMREEVDNMHLLDNTHPVNPTLYTCNSAPAMVSPNIVKTDNGYETFSIVLVKCAEGLEEIDHYIVHEMNHQFELNMKANDDNTYEGVCGWDVMEGEFNQETEEELDTLNERTDRRKYELMSEIVNELIAQDISESMIKNDRYIFNTKGHAKYKNTTSYENTFYIIRDFYEEYKKDIIESRSNGNIKHIFDVVGKENFDALNELFAIHNENFNGFAFYSLCESIKNKEDNEKTRIFYDIVRRRNEILDKMRKHSMAYEERLIKERKDESTDDKTAVC